jgi:hypothetical protein
MIKCQRRCHDANECFRFSTRWAAAWPGYVRLLSHQYDELDGRVLGIWYRVLGD